MDFTFSPDTEMLRDMLRRFVQKEARPLEMKYFNAGELAPEERARLRQAIQQLGLWGLTAPEEFGGGLDLVTACVIEEELGGTFIPVEMGDVTPLLYACRGSQVGQFLEPAMEASRRAIIAAREPDGGDRPSDWNARAEPEGDQYLLSGRKVVTSLPGLEDFLIVFADAPEGVTAFLIDAHAAGLSIGANGRMTVSLDGVKVERGAVLGEPGGALKLGEDHARAAWIRMGARYVGIGERLLEMAAEHARSWVSLGAPLAARPAIQRMVAELRVDIESARWLVYHAAWLGDQGDEDRFRSAAAQVRLATVEMLKRAVDKTTLLFNGPGVAPQIEPITLVKSQVPFETLEIALEGARAAIAAEYLDLSQA